MIELLATIPAEQMIVADTGSASIISMLEGIEAYGSEGMPEKFLHPIKWQVMTLWHRTEDIEGTVEFDQKIEVESVDKEIVMQHEITFSVKNDYFNFRIIGTFFGFPIYETGQAWVRVYLRKHGETNWEERGMFPIRVTRHAETRMLENDEGTPVDKSNEKVSPKTP